MTRIDPLISQHLRQAGVDAREAQEQGFSHVWVSETVADPFAAAATALLATEGLGVGTAISVAFARSPFVVAQSAWELSRASEGRFTLGLGTQVKAHAERRFSVAWSPPVARIGDYVRALRAIWHSFHSGERLRYEGEFYQHTLLTDHFNPGPIDHPDIPVYLSGVNTAIAELVGEVADGLIAHPLHTRDYLESTLQASVARGCERAGRSPHDVSMVVPVWVVSGDDEESFDRSYRAVRQNIGTFGSTTAYRGVFESCGWSDLPAKLNSAMKSGGPAKAGDVVPDEVVETIAIVCSPEEIADRIQQRFSGVAVATMIYEPVPAVLRGAGLRKAVSS